MTLLSALKHWYFATFLPFEDPDHPLHTPKYEEPDYSDWDDLEDIDEIYSPPSRIAFYKAPKWEKWGDKWYKKY